MSGWSFPGAAVMFGGLKSGEGCMDIHSSSPLCLIMKIDVGVVAVRRQGSGRYFGIHDLSESTGLLSLSSAGGSAFAEMVLDVI